MIIGEGLIHEGSLRAVKIEKEAMRAALEHSVIIDLDTAFGSSQTLYTKAFRRFLLSQDTWPRAETSNEKWNVLKFRERSATNGAYLFSL